MSKEEIKSASALIDIYFTQNNIDKKNLGVLNVWQKVIMSIRDNGEKIMHHSRVLDLKNGVLIVEADHSGWIQLLQLHKKYILKGLKMRLPEIEINNLTFKLKKDFSQENFSNDKINKVQLLNQLEKNSKVENENLEEQEIDVKTKESNTIDPKIDALFENLRKQIIENNKQ